jgi:hypothetical protein
MRRLIRTLAATGVMAALGMFLRVLFRDRPDLLGLDNNDAVGDDGVVGPPAPERELSSENGTPLSRRQLYEQAQRLGIEGRSKMSKRQLERAVAKAKGGGG